LYVAAPAISAADTAALPEAQGVMQGLVLLIRGVAGGASALATMVR
jgi:hypothetical protein